MRQNPGDYEASRYWEAIHETTFEEQAVGYPNLARSFNAAMYDSLRRNVAGALDASGVSGTRRVLDIGSGTGIWIDFWRRRRVREITGVELSATAVARLRQRYPEHAFIQCDVSDLEPGLPQGMDVVSAMSVLLHVTDDVRFERALRNLLAAVRPGGAVVLIEPAVVHRWWGAPFTPQASSRPRPLADYERIIMSCGGAIVAVKPATCLLANVIDTRSRISFRALEQYWGLTTRAVAGRERLGSAVGSVLRQLDALACSAARTGPSSKVIVARLRAGGCSQAP